MIETMIWTFVVALIAGVVFGKLRVQSSRDPSSEGHLQAILQSTDRNFQEARDVHLNAHLTVTAWGRANGGLTDFKEIHQAVLKEYLRVRNEEYEPRFKDWPPFVPTEVPLYYTGDMELLSTKTFIDETRWMREQLLEV